MRKFARGQSIGLHLIVLHLVVPVVCWVFLLLLPGNTAAAADNPARMALVIGNGGYHDSPLKNPPNDARAVAQALEALGFSVTLKINQNQKSMTEAIRDFGNRLKGGGIGLFYYAGHGIQVNGRNFLIPVDAAIKAEDEVPYNSLDANFVLDKMDSAKNGLNIVILDACRNNPFTRRYRSGSRGLAQMDAPSGTLIAFATAPGMEAADGDGANGLYTKHLLQQIATPAIPVEQMFKQVRIGVTRETNDKQIPWESSSLKGDFYFNPNGKIAANTVASIKPSLPSPTHAGNLRDCADCPELVSVPAGSFLMGSPTAKAGEPEWPATEIKIAKSFAVGKYEVTFSQWDRCRAEAACPKEAHSGARDPEQPVVGVTWHDAVAYTKWLSRKTGKPYRLLSEAEWEYMSRARTKTSNYWGDRHESACDYANVYDLSAHASAKSTSDSAGAANSNHYQCNDKYKRTAPVGRYQPNPFGIHDTLGNVSEWVADCWNSTLAGIATNGRARESGDCNKRSVRGGSWMSVGVHTANRASAKPEDYSGTVGFRVARSLP